MRVQTIVRPGRARRGGVFRRLRGRRGRRASFGEWARRLAGRLAAALVLAAAFPLFTVSVSAQPVADIGVCMRSAPAADRFDSGGDFAPDGPPRPPALIPPDSLVVAALGCAEAFAASTIVPIGMNIWQGLAIIITIWTGIQMMFSGGFAIGEVISLVLLLGFPFAVLQFYNTAVGTPWGPMTFSEMVVGQGRFVGEQLVDGVFVAFAQTLSSVWNQIWRTRITKDADEAAAGGGSLLNPLNWGRAIGNAIEAIGNFFAGAIRTLAFGVVLVLMGLLLIVPAVVAYCSYLWSYLSAMVAIILGPLLIPWVLIPQLQFLAWGWFRTLLGASVHMMVAGACFAVVAQILMIPLIRFGNITARSIADSAPSLLGIDAMLSVLIESLPLIVVAYLGVFKIGEITSMIMNGGSMPSSGIGDRMRSMGGMGRLARSAPGAMSGLGGGLSAGMAKGAAASTGVGLAAAAAMQVLSQATKRR